MSQPAQLDSLLNTHAYLYLIREREFVIRNLNVFKLGVTKQSMSLRVKRLDGYKKGSELILIVEVPLTTAVNIESMLKKAFKNKFQAHADGLEYFVGDRREMASMIFDASQQAWTPEEKRKQTTMLTRLFGQDIADLTDAADNDGLQPSYNASYKDDFKRWVEACITIKSDASMKTIEWYENYRNWAARNEVVPLDETKAIEVFKELHGINGLSIGRGKTYGILLSVIQVDEPIENDEWGEFRKKYIRSIPGKCQWTMLKTMFKKWHRIKFNVEPQDHFIKAYFEKQLGHLKVVRYGKESFLGWNTWLLLEQSDSETEMPDPKVTF